MGTLDRLSIPNLENPLPAFAADLRPEGSMEHEGRFILTGRRSYARGLDGSGTPGGWLAPGVSVGSVAVLSFRARGIIVGGLGVERELVDDEGLLVERIFVPRDLPALLIEWRSEAEVGRSVGIEWSFEGWGRRNGGAVSWERNGAALLANGSRHGMLAMSLLSREPEEWDVGSSRQPAATGVSNAEVSSTAVENEENGGIGLRMRARLELPSLGSARLLLIGAGGEEDLERTLRRFRSAEGQVHARAAALRKLGKHLFRLECPDPAVVGAIGVAGQRLDTLVRLEDSGLPATGYGRRPTVDPSLAAWAGIAQLMLGDFEGPARTLRALGASQTASGIIPGAPDTTLLYLLLAARSLAWTGDLGLLRSEWPRIRNAWQSVGNQATPGPLLPSTAAELSIAAEQVGDATLASELQGFDGEGTPGSTPMSGSGRWEAYASGDADTGSGDGDESSGGLESTLAIFPLVSRLLGAVPDALRGRLELHLCPPSEWDRFEVESLRMGDSRVALRYARAAQVPSSNRVCHELELRQEAGRAPLRVVLEMELPGAVESGLVDGTEADFDVREAGERSVVPLQVMLDHPRRIEVVSRVNGP